MFGILTIVLIVAALIIGAGLITGSVLSSPETSAMTSLVSAHRFRRELDRATAIGTLLSLYRLDASGRKDAAKAEIAERRAKMLKDASAFDARYQKYHYGVQVAEILRDALDEMDRR